jgi:3-oxoacyl-[acyl-carrier-protein] synthase II
MKRRVVVTGLGAVTPIGNDVESFWNGVKEGKVGIGPITRFDTTGYKATLAAELKDFVAKDRMDPRTARRMEPFSQYAVAAALEAVENSGLKMEEEDPYMVGVIIGSGVGSLQATETNEKKLMEKGPSRVDPLLVPKMMIAHHRKVLYLRDSENCHKITLQSWEATLYRTFSGTSIG